MESAHNPYFKAWNILSRQCLPIQEKEKLSTTNKAPNFTSINMPSELTELLNKGTYFIPTSDKIKISAIKKTISSEIDSTLCQIIKRVSHNSNTCRPHSKPTSDTSLTSRGNQPSYLKNKNLSQILIYIFLIMFSTQHYTQNSSYNPITYKTLQILNNSTSLKHTHTQSPQTQWQ